MLNRGSALHHAPAQSTCIDSRCSLQLHCACVCNTRCETCPCPPLCVCRVRGSAFVPNWDTRLCLNDHINPERLVSVATFALGNSNRFPEAVTALCRSLSRSLSLLAFSADSCPATIAQRGCVLNGSLLSGGSGQDPKRPRSGMDTQSCKRWRDTRSGAPRAEVPAPASVFRMPECAYEVADRSLSVACRATECLLDSHRPLSVCRAGLCKDGALASGIDRAHVVHALACGSCAGVALLRTGKQELMLRKRVHA